jgi:hypothetical protein
MSSYADLAERIANTDRRLGLITDVRFEEARRDAKAMRRADDADREQRRDQVRRHADRCRQHQERYDAAFQQFGMKAQPPRADAFPPDYRRELFKRGQDMLPSDHPLTQFDPSDIGGDAIPELERQLIEALDQESQAPSGDNIPGPDKPYREITKTDSTGVKKTEFYGAESFIKSLSRSGRRVARIVHIPTARVLWGKQFPDARG